MQLLSEKQNWNMSVHLQTKILRLQKSGIRLKMALLHLMMSHRAALKKHIGYVQCAIMNGNPAFTAATKDTAVQNADVRKAF